MSEIPQTNRVSQRSDEARATLGQAWLTDVVEPWVTQHLGPHCTAEEIYDLMLVPLLDWFAWHGAPAGPAAGERWARALGVLMTQTLVTAVARQTQEAAQDTAGPA